MSLETPEKIRTLQRKLYRKAKAEPTYRFYLLYDKIYREDILRHAYALARANAGVPGVDGQTFVDIEMWGRGEWLAGLREELISKTYRPAPVRRVMIPKPGGAGERPLGIPTIRDRVVETAAKLVLEPIFEADLEDSAYGYRPGRSAADAIKEVHRLVCRGYTDVVDAAQIVSYADDFVILSRGCATEALAWTKAVMTKLGLTINETKTSLKDARRESFNFLGYTFGPHCHRKDGRRYLGASPSTKSVQRIKDKVGELVIPRNVGPWPEVCDKLNGLLRGWSAYFSYGSRQRAYRAIDNHVYDRVRHFLARRHKAHGRGTQQFSHERVFGDLGVLRLYRVRSAAPPCASR